jgi:hypothetical protein
MGKTKSKAIDSSSRFLEGVDISGNESQIIQSISSETNFTPNKVIWRSPYYNTKQVGSVILTGKYDGKLVVLKVQGAKPEVEEHYMIEEFRKQNKSKIIRPPFVYKVKDWNKKLGYGYMIMEHVVGNKVLESSKVQTRKSIRIFLAVYREFVSNCTPTNPWLPRPKKVNWVAAIKKGYKVSLKAYPDHPLRKKSDYALGMKVASLLNDCYTVSDMEFTHGHFSTHDLKRKGKEIVLFSNLYWKWRIPYFNAVYGYHWFIYELENVKGIRQKDVDSQKKIWLGEIFAATGADTDKGIKRQVNIVLLERAISGLLLDGLMMKSKRPIAKYMVEATRVEVERLVSLLS